MSKILQEKYLHGEFKFGFELEAYVNPYQIPTNSESAYWNEIGDFEDQDPEDYWNMGRVLEVMWDAEGYQEELEGLYDFDVVKKEAKKCIDKYFPNEADWIIKPSSGVCYDGSLRVCGFEWPSPTMKFTPSAIAQCIHLLTHLQEEGIETDEKCGFHVHISSPRMTLEEAKWIVMNIAMSDEYIKLLTIFEDIDYYGEFFGSYARKDFLLDLRKAFENNEVEKLADLLNNEKYRVVRIHPQGTLEWRGPREFIGVNKEAIKDFFIKLYSVISMFIEILEKPTIGDYSKENFLSMVSNPSIEYNVHRYTEGYEKLLKKLHTSPLLLTKINISSSAVNRMMRMVIVEPNGNMRGCDIFTNAIKECVMHGKTISEDILAIILGFISISKESKRYIVKHLNQSYPFEKIFKCIKKTFPHNIDRWYLTKIFDVIDCFDTNDLLNIINSYNGDVKVFVERFVEFWKDLVNTPIPPKIKNALTQKLTEKNIDLDINSLI